MSLLTRLCLHVTFCCTFASFDNHALCCFWSPFHLHVMTHALPGCQLYIVLPLLQLSRDMHKKHAPELNWAKCTLQVLPIDGCAPVPGVVVDPAVASNCMHCIQQLGCLKIVQGCLQGDDAETSVPQSMVNEISTSDMPADVSVPEACESDASEDDCRYPQASRRES